MSKKVLIVEDDEGSSILVKNMEEARKIVDDLQKDHSMEIRSLKWKGYILAKDYVQKNRSFDIRICEYGWNEEYDEPDCDQINVLEIHPFFKEEDLEREGF